MKVIKKIILLLLPALCVASCVLGQTPTPTPYTVWKVPQLDATFLTDLQRHLWFERPAENGFVFADSVVTGGIHGTAAGKTGTFSAFLAAFIDGRLNVDATASIDYGAQGAADSDTVWVAACNYGFSPGGNFTQVGSTPYYTDVVSATKPAMTGSDTPTGSDNNCIYLMKVTISGGAITAVADLRTQAPFAYVAQDTSEVTTSPIGFFLVDSDDLTLNWWNGSAWKSVPSGDANSCATCGDSATAFFTAGQLEPARGGTGLDTSGSTGVASVSSGTWSIGTVVDESMGGTGLDLSAHEGYLAFFSGVGTAENWVTWRERIRPNDVSVDGTNCTKVSNEATLVTSVRGSAFRCADNDASTFSFATQMPEFPDGTEQVTFTPYIVNNSASSGNVVVEFTCACPATTLTSGLFPTVVAATITLDGTTGQTTFGSATVTCGGTCLGEAPLLVQANIDQSTTTFAGTLETDVSFVYILVETETSQLTD